MLRSAFTKAGYFLFSLQDSVVCLEQVQGRGDSLECLLIDLEMIFFSFASLMQWEC